MALTLLLATTPAAADWDHDGTIPPGDATTNALDAYTSQVSVFPGETVQFHVSTNPAEPYRILIYRLGWWDGPAPPQLACLPSCGGQSLGSPQPVPSPDPVTGRIAASWPVTDALTVPTTWRSGYYVARVVLLDGPKAGQGKLVPFIVREPATGRRSSTVVVAGVNTWQAYNGWGGASLYSGGPSGVTSRYGDAPHAVAVSFDRPYQNFRVGGQTLFDWELPLVRFLERGGRNVSYVTDVDVDRDPGVLLHRSLVIVAGHSEYWTMRERNALETARDSGVNLVFAGANDGYWQVRYEDGGRTIIGYKGQSDWTGKPDPQAGTEGETTRFRDLAVPDPECMLEGVQHGGLVDPPGYAARVPNPADSPWFAGSGFRAGDTLPAFVGYEWDRIEPGCTPRVKPGTALTALFHTDASDTDGTIPYDAVSYTAPSGARVFSAGTFEFSWGLDSYGMDTTAGRRPPDPRLQRFATNMLDDLDPSHGEGSGTPQSPQSLAIDRITNLRIRPSTIVAATRGPSVLPARRPRTGASVSYLGSQPANTSFTVQRAAKGRRQGRRCVRPTARNRGLRRCIRYRSVGSFGHADVVGLNRFRFTGRVRGRTLSAGRYRLRAIPSNDAGVGRPAYRGFRVKR